MSHIPNLFSKRLSSHILGPVSRTCFSDSEFPNFSVLCDVYKPRAFQIIKCLLLFAWAPFQFISFLLNFTISSTFKTLLGNLLSYISKFTDYKFCFPPNIRSQLSQVFYHFITIIFPPVSNNIFLMSFWDLTRDILKIHISIKALQGNLDFFYHAPQNSFNFYPVFNSKASFTFLHICYSKWCKFMHIIEDNFLWVNFILQLTTSTKELHSNT